MRGSFCIYNKINTLYITIIFFFLFSSTSCRENPLVFDQTEDKISLTTQAILQRYYLIARLQKAVALVCKARYQEALVNAISSHIFSCFSQSEILFTLKKIQEMKNFDPLLKLWDDILCYRRLYDDNFSHEFARLIFILIQELTHALSAKNLFTQCFEVCEVEAIDIAYRFYMIKRLQPFLLRLHKCTAQYFDFSFSTTLFSHERVMWCVHKLHEKKNITPLLQLSTEFQEFKYCHDVLFTREFLTLLLLLTKKYASSETVQIYSYTKPTIEEFLTAVDIHIVKLLQDLQEQKKNSRKLLYGLFMIILLSSATINISKYIFV